eukprot:m.273549 g.273549  ORF g.273549 m.273549 type:complete len:532 (+) comp107472_c0_seq1:301-1896(+)
MATTRRSHTQHRTLLWLQLVCVLGTVNQVTISDAALLDGDVVVIEDHNALRPSAEQRAEAYTKWGLSINSGNVDQTHTASMDHDDPYFRGTYAYLDGGYSASVFIINVITKNSSGIPIVGDWTQNELGAGYYEAVEQMYQGSYGAVHTGALDYAQVTLGTGTFSDSTSTIRSKALAAANSQTNQIIQDNYNHIAFYFSPVACVVGCAGIGTGFIGDSQAPQQQVWLRIAEHRFSGNVNGAPYTSSKGAHTLAHEIFHNLGLSHSNRYLSDGTIDSYQDTDTMMGSSGSQPKTLDGKQRYCMGFMPKTALTIYEGGPAISVDLLPVQRKLDGSTTEKQLVRIQIPGNESFALFVDFRGQAGYNSIGGCPNAPAVNGVDFMASTFRDGVDFEQYTPSRNKISVKIAEGNGADCYFNLNARMAVLTEGESYTFELSGQAVQIKVISIAKCGHRSATVRVGPPEAPSASPTTLPPSAPPTSSSPTQTPTIMPTAPTSAPVTSQPSVAPTCEKNCYIRGITVSRGNRLIQTYAQPP